MSNTQKLAVQLQLASPCSSKDFFVVFLVFYASLEYENHRFVSSSEYGGMGLDFSYNIAVAEELGNIRCGGIPVAIGVQAGMATPALTR